MVEIKFCGLTRPEDAREAAAIGARYVGVVFAESPRQLTDDAAHTVLDQVPLGISRVGVFGDMKPEQIALRAEKLGLDVVQLHGDPKPRTIARVRKRWQGRVWAVQRINGADVPATASDLFDAADAIVLDSRVTDKLGGTGVVLPWDELRDRIASIRTSRTRLVIAGGLNAENVARAIQALQPDVVDVSSGVESSPGVKDHEKMRAFRDAVMAADIAR
ncbi:MAG: phosphoribosylanthranilate isomerase [Gemmatimonadaceae bacterium]